MKQDGISYEVFTKNQTRTVDSYCEQHRPGAFNVWAQVADAAGTLYIEGDQIKNNDPDGSGSWYDATGTRYWPQDKNLNFFAEVNGQAEFDYNNGAPKFNNFKVKPTVADQLDLMYSVNMGAVNNGSPVALNFRHALSQVCFRATNNTNNLDVTINSVSVGHLTDGGSYTYPLATTDGPIVDPGHDDIYNEGTVDRNRGSWALDENYVNEYVASVNGGQVVIKTTDTEKTKNLTCPESNHANGWANVMTLMPQKVEAWNPEKKGTDYNGAYFLLDVVLNDNGTNGVQIHKGKIAIPVNIDWKEGYRYIYTFVFNEGSNGGYTPTPDNPQPVLTGISYTVTVDDFIPASADAPNGTDMNTEETEEPAPVEYTYSYSVVNDGTVLASATEKSEKESYTFTLPDVAAPEKDGYDFAGWKSSVNGSVSMTLPASVTINKGGNVTFTATWTEKPVETTYTVTFDPNMEGQNVYAMPDPNPLVVKNSDGSYTFTLPGNDDAPRTNGVFCHGWTLVKDAENIDYPNGSTVTLTPENKEITLYVAWRSGTPAGGSGDIIGGDPTVKSGN